MCGQEKPDPSLEEEQDVTESVTTAEAETEEPAQEVKQPAWA